MGLNHLKLVLLTWETCGFCPQLLKNVSTAVHQDRGANSIQKMTVHVCGLASSLSAGSVIGAFVVSETCPGPRNELKFMTYKVMDY